LLTNASALIASRLVVAALGWAGTIFVIRNLTPTEWGQFSFVFSVLGMLSFITALGSNRVVLARLARVTEDRGAFAGTYVVLRLVLGLLAYVLALAFVWLAGYPEAVVRTTALAGVILIIGAGSSGLDVIFQTELKLGVVATATILGQIAQLALTVAVAFTAPGLLLFIFPAIAYDLIGALWKLRRVGALLNVRYVVDLVAWRFILVQAAPLATAGALGAVSGRIDVILLSKIDDFEAVGYLAVADKFGMVADFIPMALTPPLLTLLVRSWPEDPERYYATVRRAMLLMAVAAGAVMVGFVPIAEELIGLLYGSRYEDAAPTAVLTVAATCLSFFGVIILEALVAKGRNRDFVSYAVVVLVLTVATSLVLIPEYSYLGAGVARFATTCAMLLLLWYFVRTRMTAPVLERWRTAGVVASAAACTLLGLGLNQLVPWPIAAGAAVATYTALLHYGRVTGRGGLRSLWHDV
jgi:O-antigen/teichoic acid export membrane protein